MLDKMLPKNFIAISCSLIAFICVFLVVLGVFGLVDLMAFAVGPENGIKVLSYIAVACLLFAAILYYDE